MKGPESIGDGDSPLIEPCRDERSGLGVTLGELASKRAKCAAPLSLGALRRGEYHVPPRLDAVWAAECAPIAIDDGVGLVVDDRLDEVVLVGEVVVQLRAADSRRRLDVLEEGARYPPLVDQGGRLLHYPRPGALALGGEPRPGAGVVVHASHASNF